MLIKKPFKKGMGSSSAPYYKTAASSFQGPGDIVSGAVAWGSSARAYSAAFAAGGTAIMDLVDQAGANPITINILTTGFVNLAAINAWVTANSVTTIKVTKLYDQSGTGNHFTNVTLGTMPVLTLNSLGGLPGMTGTGANNTVLTSLNNVTQAQPYTMSAVAQRGAILGSNTGIIAAGTSAISMGYVATTANTGFMNTNGAGLSPTISDAAFHALSGVFNAASSTYNVDGTDNTGPSIGTLGFSAEKIRIFRTQGAVSSNNIIMEVGVWPTGFTSGNLTSMSANQHGASNGYNF